MLSIRTSLGFLVVTGALIGVWATGYPADWYASFPGFGHHWVSVDGSYNLHLVRDVGGAYLMIAALAGVALVRPALASPTAVGIASACFNLPHLAYDATHLAMYSPADATLSIAALARGRLLAVSHSRARGRAGMKMSDGVEWGLHCLTVLAILPEGAALPGRALAEFHGVSESYLLKHLKALAANGLLVSLPGARGGYRLARPAEAISFLDVVHAIDGREPAFRCRQIRRCGPAASDDPVHYQHPCAIHAAMMRAEAAWHDELRRIRLSDMLGELAATLPADTRARATAWLKTSARG